MNFLFLTLFLVSMAITIIDLIMIKGQYNLDTYSSYVFKTSNYKSELVLSIVISLLPGVNLILYVYLASLSEFLLLVLSRNEIYKCVSNDCEYHVRKINTDFHSQLGYSNKEKCDCGSLLIKTHSDFVNSGKEELKKVSAVKAIFKILFFNKSAEFKKAKKQANNEINVFYTANQN